MTDARAWPGWMLGVFVVAGCSSGAEAPSAGPPAPGAEAPQRSGWSDALAAALAEDESAEPDVFETRLAAYPASLEIVPGKPSEVWTYNGRVSGPEIRVKRGDRLIVHFTNRLPEPTTIH
ncbi:MAG TPA: multicopper oxidase domain-containing protein, partial [Polyangiaceae bacterium]